MGRRTSGQLTVLATVLAALFLYPSGASAGPVTLGQTFDPSVDGGCSGGYTRLQTTSPGDQYEVPFPGVITEWRFQANASPPPQIQLKVGRPAPGTNTFEIIGESPLATPTPNELNTFPVDIPVQPGDLIGNYTPNSGDCADFSPPPGYEGAYRLENVLVGETRAFSLEPIQLDLAARLRPYRCGGRDATIAGTRGPDVLVGTSGRDVIVGLNGRDRIKGLGAKDRLCGNKGRDKIKGGGGDDLLKGARGKDRLNGGSGTDVCSGGPGDDRARNCEVERSI